MIAVTDRLLSSLRESHTVSTVVRLYRPDDLVTPIEAQVVGGSVSIDGDARIRRTASVEAVFSLWDPASAALISDLPFGGQCAIERGVAFPDGTHERVQLGRFRVDALTWAATEGRLSMTLNDRMQQVADEPFLAPWSPVGMKPSTAIATAVHDVYGDTILYHVLTVPASETALADTVLFERDRAQAISDLAASIHAEAFFDHLGDFVIRPKPDGSGDVAWTIDAGDRGVMVGALEALDRSSVRNGVVVYGQGNGDQPPFYSVIHDDEPTSPTKWGGPFGKVAEVVTLNSIPDQATADLKAAQLLAEKLGLSRTVTLDGVPNPALEAGDLVEIVYPDLRTETLLISTVGLGLGPDANLALGVKTAAGLGLPPPPPDRFS